MWIGETLSEQGGPADFIECFTISIEKKCAVELRLTENDIFILSLFIHTSSFCCAFKNSFKNTLLDDVFRNGKKWEFSAFMHLMTKE